LHTK